MKSLSVCFFAIFFLTVSSYPDSYDPYEESAGLFGVGGGYTTGFVPHKDLRNYNSNGGFFIQLSVLGNAISLVYHRDFLELEKDIVDSYKINDPGASLRRLTFGYNIPIPIVAIEEFVLALTVNYGFGGYRFVLSSEAYNKLGRTNLTKIHNSDLKFGQYAGIGLTTTLFERINLNFSWNVDWVVKDYKGWYIITSSLVPLFIGETDNFTKVMLGLSFMFGKNLEEY